VVSRSSPQIRPSRRDRRRQETITDIKTAARTQLAEGGPAGISLRAIARQLGMTPAAVHYYFPGREALLDALIVSPTGAKPPRRWLAFPMAPWSPA
jgi:AcrR family transcriptional regulator